MYRRRAISEDTFSMDARVSWTALGLSTSGLVIYQDRFTEALTHGADVNGFRLDPLPLRRVPLRRTGPYTFSLADPSPTKRSAVAYATRMIVKRPVQARRKRAGAKFFYDPESKPPTLADLGVDNSFELPDAFVYHGSIRDEPSMERIGDALSFDFWSRLGFTALAEPFQWHAETL